MRRPLATFFVVTCSACAPPTQYGGPIAVDDAGFAARLHRACGLGKAAPTRHAVRSARGASRSRPSRHRASVVTECIARPMPRRSAHVAKHFEALARRPHADMRRKRQGLRPSWAVYGLFLRRRQT